MELITKDNENVIAFLKALDRMLDNVEQVTKNCRPTFDGEHFLTDREMSERFKICRRALQDYRTQGKTPYIHLGGKVLYKNLILKRY